MTLLRAGMKVAHWEPIADNGLRTATQVIGLSPTSESPIKPSSSLSRCGSGWASSGRERPRLVRGFVPPNRPGDAGELVGDGDRGFVVTSRSLEVKSPGAQPIRFGVAFGGQHHGAGAVSEQQSAAAVPPWAAMTL